MTKQTGLPSWVYAVFGVLALLCVFFVATDFSGAPETVTETVTLTDYVEVPVEVIKEVEVVAPIVIEGENYTKEDVQELLSETDREKLVLELFDEEIKDDDFLEDLHEYLLDEGYDIEDQDDLEIVSSDDYDLDWDAGDGREDGEGEVNVELKVSYLEDGDDDDHTVRVDVTFELDDEDLEEFEGYEFD
jgi:hypothetical protein